MRDSRPPWADAWEVIDRKYELRLQILNVKRAAMHRSGVGAGSLQSDTPKPKHPEQPEQPKRKLSLVARLAIVTTACALVFSVIVFADLFDRRDMHQEQLTLLEILESDVPLLSAFDLEMRSINPDYLCWITIEGTEVDYPVVRGNDNETYLDLSFFGADNRYGTLFMDYRCVGDYVPHIIIYGHNSRHGDMFGSLREFLDGQHLAEHPLITLKINDRVVEYEIFSVRKTDIHDPAYDLAFGVPGAFRAFAERCGAPSGTTQILTLSTCVSGNNDDERLIVQGAFRETTSSL